MSVNKKNSDGTYSQYANVPYVTKDNLGLAKVENKSSSDIRGELTQANITKALGYTPLSSALKGANSGLAELDANGKVPSAQLPSYVDDVIEASSKSNFPTTGETGKIYVDTSNNKTYRWSGTSYVEISASIALGETSSTAYRGDRGKIAYDHSQSTHARADASKVEASTTNGNIKIDGTETTVYTHPAGTNPHGTTKADVGLSNVGNFKAVSTVASQGLNDTEKTNARANIGAAPSSAQANVIETVKVNGTALTPSNKAVDIIIPENTWRGIQNNLTSTSTTDSLSAYQGKLLNDEIVTLKNSVSDGKSSIASAITNQGVTTASDATFATMATNIATVASDKYNAGSTAGQATAKAAFEPKTATVTQAGAITVANASGTTVLSTTTSNSYNAGVAATKKGTAVAANVLAGKTFTNSSSVGVSGTMPDNTHTGTPSIKYGSETTATHFSDSSLNAGGQYRIPAGYHDGKGVVSGNSLASQTGVDSGKSSIDASHVYSGYQGWVNGNKITGTMGDATVTSGSATITSASYAYSSDDDDFKVTGSATIEAPSVSTAGYLSATKGTKNTNTASLSTTVAKVGLGASISGSSTKTPSISKVTKPTGDTWTDGASGATTTTKPVSGVYVAVQSAKNTGTLTATPNVTSAGYGTTSNYGATAATKTVGANASSVTYVPVKGGSATTPTASGASTSTSLSGTTLTVARSVTPTVSEGWVSAGTAGTVTITGTVPTENKSATPSASSQTISPSAGKLLSSVTVNATPTQTKTATPSTSSQTISPDSGKFLSSVTVNPMPSGSLNNAATTGVTYTESTDATTVIPAEGALYINAGYIPNTKILLSHLIPDDANYTNAGSGQIRSGYEAYSPDGKKLIGTIADVTPKFTGGTASLTGTSNAISTNMTTATSGDYYIDATAKAKATRTAVTYNGAATGYINVASGTSASAANTSAEGSISATRIYVPTATSSVTNGTANATANAGTASVKTNPSASASLTRTGNIGSTTAPTSGTAGTDYWVFTSSASANSGVVTATGGSASASVTASSATVGVGYNPESATASTTASSTGTKTGNTVTTTAATASDSSSVYLTKSTCTVAGGGLTKGTASGGGLSGGGLSGGGLTAGNGEVSVTNGTVTPSISGSSITNATTYGITTTKPSTGTDGTNYLTFDPGASVTTNGTAKGRGSVSRAAVTRAKVDRAAFSQRVTRAAITDAHTAGYMPAKDAATAIASTYTDVSLAAGSIAADSTTIGAASGTSNWSDSASTNPTIAAGTNYYIPVVAATATAGTASASASIAKDPTASASLTRTGDIGTTTKPSGTAGTDYWSFTSSASAASGYSTASASATGGSASVGKGITAGGSATGAASGNKSATSNEKTASDSSSVYLVKAAGSVTMTAGNGSVTGSNVTLSDTNNGISVTGKGAVSATAKITTAGYTPTNTSFATGSSTNSNSATKYITAVAVPKDIPFSVSTTADTALDTTSNLTVSNAAYRQVAITNAANGDVNITNSGQNDYTAGGATAGTLTVNAYNNAATPALTGAKTVVSAGKWNRTSLGATSSSGTYYGAVDFTKPTQKAAATITPTTSSQTAVAANTYCTGAITVAAIPSNYVAPTATKTAATFYTSTSDQSIAAGTYCSGAQTIKAVTTSNIEAGNIKKGVVVKVGDANNAGRIKNITGTLDYIKTVSSVPTTRDTSIIYNTTDKKYYLWKD